MTLKIEIELDNAAFDSSDGDEQNTASIDRAPETARILRKLADRLESETITGAMEIPKLIDLNGNNVGFARVED